VIGSFAPFFSTDDEALLSRSPVNSRCVDKDRWFDDFLAVFGFSGVSESSSECQGATAEHDERICESVEYVADLNIAAES